MKILLFGKNGQVGWELQRALAPLGEVVALDRQGKGRFSGDLLRLDLLVATIRAVRPDVIVNAAAHTAVDDAEGEAELSRQINVRAPAVMAREAAALGALLVHYSTDYVFDGSGDRPWREDDPTGPLSIYGLTKLEGEQEIHAAACRHLIIRTSWVYAVRGENFVRTILRLAREREHLKIITDQIGAPTGAELIADSTAHSIRALQERPELSGVYHLAAAGETSWHGYASFVIENARARGEPLTVAPGRIEPIAAAAAPARASRPLNSRLDTGRFRRTFGLVMPDWRFGVARMLDEILSG
ncbi:dTDP-4-dehydrorhamnose reductase [Cognatazoarcus halotolerans]|uniref:dTDP-4-dehydrorhamnose reductase n=1 Tax=Cognatazoarcus halotolerans TaxID=2686016 RepID=UPI00135C0EDA|nr:dTDP-4-dehydrorhamnose reductase [Cognatazoarcus halotolerans]MCB1898695.1 dTDP-4-dehydrorhamnose reductase [Rhodocyclaceae bacterium]MCP5310884.1 dTDP-4-dehydrorhamnose reductase [Zoogloeaceae bacterium]